MAVQIGPPGRRLIQLGIPAREEYTDLAVVVGPNSRWVADDYDDLCSQAPEVLLGYQVRLATPNSVAEIMRGRVVSKLFLLHGPYSVNDRRAIEDAESAVVWRDISSEWLAVHRTHGVRRYQEHQREYR